MTKYIVPLIMLVCWSCIVSAAMPDTEAIDAVWEKAYQQSDVLSNADLDAIDDFLEESFDELLDSATLAEAVGIRRLIVARKGDNQQNQYSVRFILTCSKQIQESFKKIEEWTDTDFKTQMELNLVIIAAELQSFKVAEIGLERLNSDNMTIRYWAARVLANPGIAKAFDDQDNAQLKDRIVKAFQDIIKNETYPEILKAITVFTNSLNSTSKQALLISLAQRRIVDYQDWVVEYELLDMDILKSLGTNLKTSSQQAKRSFAQLYSYVIQRYLLGKDKLSETSILYLESVIIEIEQTVITKLLGKPRGNLKKAIEQRNIEKLQLEHDELLGSLIKPGEFADALGFDYGKNAQGNSVTVPEKMILPSMGD